MDVKPLSLQGSMPLYSMFNRFHVEEIGSRAGAKFCTPLKFIDSFKDEATKSFK